MMKLWCVVVVVVAACGQSNRLPAEAWGVADYASAGLHIDKSWTADDCTAAENVLAKITAEHRERLPRFHGAKSGAVFAKLVADLPDDAATPIRERFIAHATRFQALNGIAKLYLPNQLDTPPREYIELMGAVMRDAVVEESLAQPFLATFAPDDPSRPARLEGLEQMHSGFGTMLLGAVLVADQTRLSDDDRIAMLEHVTAALPVLFPPAHADTQQRIRDALAKEVAGFPAGPLRDAAAAAQRALPK